MTTPPSTLLSTDAVPIASVVLPRELTPKGAPTPTDRDPPIHSAARTRRLLVQVIAALAVGVPALWLTALRALPAAWFDAAVIATLAVIGLALVGAVVWDDDRWFHRRRRRGWLRALTAMGGEPRPAHDDRLAMQITRGPRRYLVEIGADAYGLQCAWLTALPEPGEVRAPITLCRRSTARRWWPTGDPEFDARVGVSGPLEARVALFDLGARAIWLEAVGRYDVSVEDGRLYFSLAYAPRTARVRPISRLVCELCVAAERLVHRPHDLPARLTRLLRDPGPPAIAANALRALRAHQPGTRATADAEAWLLAHDDPWRRLLAAEVGGREEALVELLMASDCDVRSRALDALIEIWPLDGLAERLDVMLDHPEGAMRGAALTALGRRNLPLADLRLAAAAADPDPAVGLGLLDWLDTTAGPRADAALIRLLAHPAPPVVHRAIERLGRVGAATVEDRLVELTRHPDHRAAALRGLTLLRQRYPKSLGGAPKGGRRRR